MAGSADDDRTVSSSEAVREEAAPYEFDEHSEPFEAACSECGALLEKEPELDDQEFLCRSCVGSEQGAARPVTAWQKQWLDPVSVRILSTLKDAYPDGLNARQLTDSLRRAGFDASEADKSEVNSRLYGSLSKWLVSEGETPPYWSLKTVDAEEASGEVLAPADTNAQESCGQCSNSITGRVYIGENRKILCSVCDGLARGRRPATSAWHQKSMSYLTREILKSLDKSYPEGLTAKEISQQLRDKGFLRDMAAPTKVTDKLKGPLFRWTRAGEGKSTYWTLKPASED